MNQADLENRFTHHLPAGNQAQKYEAIRKQGLAMAEFIVATSPESREQSLAITKLEEVVFWANAAIARNEAQGDK